jgi:hypothetical protein
VFAAGGCFGLGVGAANTLANEPDGCVPWMAELGRKDPELAEAGPPNNEGDSADQLNPEANPPLPTTSWLSQTRQ